MRSGLGDWGRSALVFFTLLRLSPRQVCLSFSGWAALCPHSEDRPWDAEWCSLGNGVASECAVLLHRPRASTVPGLRTM